MKGKNGLGLHSYDILRTICREFYYCADRENPAVACLSVDQMRLLTQLLDFI